jgi:hypothetical protein
MYSARRTGDELQDTVLLL